MSTQGTTVSLMRAHERLWVLIIECKRSWKSISYLDSLLQKKQSGTLMYRHERSWSGRIAHESSWVLIIEFKRSWNCILHVDAWYSRRNHSPRNCNRSYMSMNTHEQAWTLMNTYQSSWPILANYGTIEMQLYINSVITRCCILEKRFISAHERSWVVMSAQKIVFDWPLISLTTAHKRS